MDFEPRVWRDAWRGTSDSTPWGATNAIVKIIFSYAGYTNAFGLVNEMQNPTKTLRWSAPSSLIAVTVLYILVNVAYFSVGRYLIYKFVVVFMHLVLRASDLSTTSIRRRA